VEQLLDIRLLKSRNSFGLPCRSRGGAADGYLSIKK
jgi:hypothetical protein